MDQNITPNVRLFGRFTQDRVVTTVIPAYYGNEFPTTEDIETPPATNEVLNLTYSVRPNLVNALSFAYSGQHDGIRPTVTGIDSVSGSILYPTGLQVGSMFPVAASGITPLGKVLPGISVGGEVRDFIKQQECHKFGGVRARFFATTWFGCRGSTP